jgi:AcrR family transcriptional regulator
MEKKKEGRVADYILEALLILIRKKEWQDISVTEICDKAGVTRMSFYRSYESKEDVLQKWIVKVTDRFMAESGIDFLRDSREEYLLKLFRHVTEYKERLQVIYRAGLIHFVQEEFDRVMLAHYKGKYSDYQTSFLSGGIYNVFLLWLRQGCRETPEEMAKIVGTFR